MIKFIKKFYVDYKFGFKQCLIFILIVSLSLFLSLIVSSIYDININDILLS